MVLLGSIARVALITVGTQTALRMEFVLICSQVKVTVKTGFYAIVHIVLPPRFQSSIYRLSSMHTSSIAPMGTWQPNSHMVQKHIAREIKAQWNPLERKESLILNDVIVYFFLPHCVPYSPARRFCLTRLFSC